MLVGQRHDEADGLSLAVLFDGFDQRHLRVGQAEPHQRRAHPPGPAVKPRPRWQDVGRPPMQHERAPDGQARRDVLRAVLLQDRDGVALVDQLARPGRARVEPHRQRTLRHVLAQAHAVAVDANKRRQGRRHGGAGFAQDADGHRRLADGRAELVAR